MEDEENIKRLLDRIKGRIPKSAVKEKPRNKKIKENNMTKKKYYLEKPKCLSILDKCQVLVVGGGPSGLSAAIGASRTGMDVILMERFGCFGGVITTVGMETLGWYRYEGTQDVEGIGREMERIAKRMGGTSKWPYNDSDCLDAESFKYIADQLVKQHNIRPLLHVMAVDSIIEDGKIKGIIVESKSGRQVIYAERVIDCTGDADIAYFSNCPFTTLDVKDRMSVTGVFNCSGVNKKLFLEHVKKNPKTFADWDSNWNQLTTGKEDHLNTPYLGKEFKQAVKDGIITKGQHDKLSAGLLEAIIKKKKMAKKK